MPSSPCWLKPQPQNAPVASRATPCSRPVSAANHTDDVSRCTPSAGARSQLHVYTCASLLGRSGQLRRRAQLPASQPIHKRH